MELNRTPLYLQIVDLLRTELADGTHPAGARFPSERELAGRFSVSRTTANKILSVLVSEGRLQHRKGLGAFVSAPSLAHDISTLLSFTEKARRSGMAPETHILAFRKETHPELGACLYMVRHRFADGLPVILEKRWIPEPLGSGLTREMASGSLYEAFSTQLGLSVGHAEQQVRAVTPVAEERTRLGIRSGTACLRVVGRGFLTDGTLLWVEDTLFRGDLFSFHATLGPAGLPGQHTQGTIMNVPKQENTQPHKEDFP